MSKFNYNEISRKHPVQNAVVTPSNDVSETTDDSALINQNIQETTQVPETPKEPEAPQTQKVDEPTCGTVTDCVKLNVRKLPNRVSEPVCIVDAGTELTIDLDSSTSEWYSVCVNNDVKGYCMRKFVTIKE